MHVSAGTIGVLLSAGSICGVLGGALGSTIGLRPTCWVCAIGEVLAALWVIASPLLRMRDVPPEMVNAVGG
ncbi:MAG: hypothetical protein ACRDQA_17270 [Nocardioidaceae bacterium]